MKPGLRDRFRRRNRKPATPRRTLIGLSLVIVVALVVLWLASYLADRLAT